MPRTTHFARAARHLWVLLLPLHAALGGDAQQVQLQQQISNLTEQVATLQRTMDRQAELIIGMRKDLAALGVQQVDLKDAERTAPAIAVENPSRWGDAEVADIKAVLRSAELAIWQRCPRARMGTITIYHRDDYPQTDLTPTPDGGVKIGLNTGGRLWCQYSYQFAHEFCHALAGHSETGRQGSHRLEHANMWLEESLCEAASRFAIGHMAESWKIHPPYPNWASYSQSLASYASNLANDKTSQLPQGVSFAEWFRANEPAMRTNAVLRSRNALIARQLLPLLEEEPRGWEAVCYLHLAPQDDTVPLSRYLAEWQTACPEHLRPFVGKIRAVFGL